MNKLGFAIKRASEGAGIRYKCNEGPWTNKVTDIREYLKLFTGLDGTDNAVSFMSFDETGCYLTLLRAISGRTGDFLSGWIYIPNTLDITGKQVVAAHDFVKKVLMLSNLSEIKDEIETFFGKEYPQREFSPSYNSTNGSLFGVRFLGLYYSLEEILDKDRYQDYYSQYKAIFLLDKSGPVQISKENSSKFENLTNTEIKKYCVLRNPSINAIKALGKDVRVQYKGKDFLCPIIVKKGTKVELSLIRPGFESQKLQPITVSEEVQNVELPSSCKWMKEITGSLFKVYDHKTKEPIKAQSLRILVNNTDIITRHCALSEEECRNAKITVSANGYEEVSDQVDLLDSYNNPVKVSLRKKKTSYSRDIILRNGETAKMSLEGESIPSPPLEGYDYNSEMGAFELSSKYVWKQRLWGALGTLAAVLLIWSGVKIVDWWDSHEFQFGWPPIVEKAEEQSDQFADVTEVPVPTEDETTSKAIEYMNNNDKWAKDTLDKLVPDLYDMINGYRFEEITQQDYPNCDNFARIKRMAKTMLDAGHKMAPNHFCDDGVITLDNWVTKVNEMLTKASLSTDNASTNSQVDKSNESASQENKNSHNQSSRITGKASSQEAQKSNDKSKEKAKTKEEKPKQGEANKQTRRGGIPVTNSNPDGGNH